MLRYVVMERTPFPGYFKPMAICFLQDAEFKTGMAQRWGSYHVGAQPLGELLTYSEADAHRIVEHCQQEHPYAEHYLFGVVEKPMEGCGEEKGSRR